MTIAPMLLSWCPGKTPPDPCDPCACTWVNPTIDNVSGTNPRTFTIGIARATIGACDPVFAMAFYQDQSIIGGSPLYWMGGIVGPPNGAPHSAVNVVLSYKGTTILTFAGQDNAVVDEAEVPTQWKGTEYVYQGMFHYSSWTAPAGLISETLHPNYPTYGFVWSGPIDNTTPQIITMVVSGTGSTGNPAQASYFNGNPRAPQLPGFRLKSSVVRIH
jgi:hypothetical protein